MEWSRPNIHGIRHRMDKGHRARPRLCKSAHDGIGSSFLITRHPTCIISDISHGLSHAKELPQTILDRTVQAFLLNKHFYTKHLSSQFLTNHRETKHSYLGSLIEIIFHTKELRSVQLRSHWVYIKHQSYTHFIGTFTLTFMCFTENSEY